MKATFQLLSSIPKPFKDSRFLNMNIKPNKNLNQNSKTLENVFNSNNINCLYKNWQNKNISQKQLVNILLSVSFQKVPQQKLIQLLNELKNIGVNPELSEPIKVPWFPMEYSDLDYVGKHLILSQQTANEDHPFFNDPQYLKRISHIKQVAYHYQMGQDIPDVEYTTGQTQLFLNIVKRLRVLHKGEMCQRYETGFEKLNSLFHLDRRIPQLNEVSAYLKEQTGFTIKPVHGMISPREFLNALAFKVFMSTQYIRHPKYPDYTPQADVVHEIMGHFPTLADKDIADFSQHLGLLSLGASDQMITKIGRIYFCTLEFGMYKKDGKIMNYGAGPAACISEIQMIKSGKAIFEPLTPENICGETFPIRDLQHKYFVQQQFNSGLEQLKTYGQNLQKPFKAFFDKQTNSIKFNRSIQMI